MAFSINTNTGAMAALSTLRKTDNALEATQGRINSGQKVAGARDNASIFAIAQGMRGDVAGMRATQETLSMGEATVSVALKAAENVSTKLNDIKEKIVSAQSSNVDRAALQRDIKSTVETIDSIVSASQFNGVNLLNGSATGTFDVLSSIDRTSATTVAAKQINVEYQDITAATLGISGIEVDGGTATLTFDNTLDPQVGETVTITTFAKDDTGAATTHDYVFEFVDGATAPTTVPVEAGGVNSVKVFAVEVDPGTQSPLERIGKLVDKMKEAGLSASVQNDGSLFLSANTSDGTSIGVSAVASTVTGYAAGTVTTGQPAPQIDVIEDAINTMKEVVSKLGTSANQLKAQGEFISDLKDVMETGIGTLVDADLAEESAKLQALQTKKQLGIQALSIANQGPSALMSLFR